MKKTSAPSAPTWDDLTPLEKLFGAGLVVMALAVIGREYRWIEHKKMVDERMRLVKVLREEMKARNESEGRA